LIGEKEGDETEQQISDALSPFKKTETIVLSSGIGTMPTDYWHKLGMRSLAGGADFVSKNIDFVSYKECERRIDCSIDFPSVTYPIVELKSTTFKVYPTSITSVLFTYRKHDYPQLNLSYTNDIPEYTTSIELLWGQDRYIDIIRLILGYLNLPVSNEQVLQYVESKTQQQN
jgi:hypothetical protein